MAIEEAKVTIYTCDDPACHVRIICETDELPDGYHGDVSRIDTLGGTSGKWFACRVTHIRGAIEGALARRHEEEHQ